MIRYLVGRCHVGQSNRAVIKYVMSKVRKDALLNRAQRHRMMRECIKEHAANRKLYRQVMSGRF